MSVENKPLVLLKTVDDVTEAELLRSTLEANDMAVLIQERNGFGAAIQAYSIHINLVYDIFVAPSQVEAARTIVDTLNAEQDTITEEELSQAASEMYDERV